MLSYETCYPMKHVVLCPCLRFTCCISYSCISCSMCTDVGYDVACVHILMHMACYMLRDASTARHHTPPPLHTITPPTPPTYSYSSPSPSTPTPNSTTSPDYTQRARERESEGARERGRVTEKRQGREVTRRPCLIPSLPHTIGAHHLM